MGFSLDKVVPWGRSFDEYVAMFGLSAQDLEHRILGCGDGPASFNAELTRRNGQVTSLDPIYAFNTGQIRERITETFPVVMDQLRHNISSYVWTTFRSPDDVGRERMAAMEAFLKDFETGRAEGRYVVGELPSLPFVDDHFDLALSSHFLFLYSDHLTADFHLHSLTEMLRVAHEVRVFPLLTLDARRSPCLEEVTDKLGKAGHTVTIRRVPYEFQRGGNEVLVIERNGSLT